MATRKGKNLTFRALALRQSDYQTCFNSLFHKLDIKFIFWSFNNITKSENQMDQIKNCNRTKWSPIRSVIIRVINKIRQPQSGSPICLSWVWLKTELDDKKSCYQLIITISISEKTNTPRTNISSGDNILSSIFLHFGNCLVFLWISGCCYGYCDQFCDWWI